VNLLRRALLSAALLGLGCGPVSAPPKPSKPVAQAPAPAGDAVPEQAKEVLAYIRAHHEAPAGYEGGRRFGNYEHALPAVDGNGRRIQYQEWDVNPLRAHVNRGAERLVTGSDGRAWYTGDHYAHFTEVP
jgi:guanyl-specific ribonuclease Sa